MPIEIIKNNVSSGVPTTISIENLEITAVSIIKNNQISSETYVYCKQNIPVTLGEGVQNIEVSVVSSLYNDRKNFSQTFTSNGVFTAYDGETLHIQATPKQNYTILNNNYTIYITCTTSFNINISGVWTSPKLPLTDLLHWNKRIFETDGNDFGVFAWYATYDVRWDSNEDDSDLTKIGPCYMTVTLTNVSSGSTIRFNRKLCSPHPSAQTASYWSGCWEDRVPLKSGTYTITVKCETSSDAGYEKTSIENYYVTSQVSYTLNYTESTRSINKAALKTSLDNPEQLIFVEEDE